MGFKFINSREYRELCERVAFVESDLNDARREADTCKRILETKEDTIRQLKKQVVSINDEKNELKVENSELKGQIAEWEVKYNMLQSQHDAQEKAALAEKPARKPRATRKPKKTE